MKSIDSGGHKNMIINYKNVIVSKQSNDFTLLYNKGKGKYYLYYQEKELMTVKTKDNPQSLADTVFGMGTSQMDNFNDEEITKQFYIKMVDEINDKEISLQALQNICNLLNSASENKER